MARGNQRDKAREANQKKMAEQVNKYPSHLRYFAGAKKTVF
jgi:hypothetical protein